MDTVEATTPAEAASGPSGDRLPRPTPDPIIAQLVNALQRLRDGVDNELAMFGPDDEIQERLGPRLDDATEALAKLGKWVVEPETAK